MTDPHTRLALQRIAAHVLGRRRYQISGRFGLRATPGGFGTPAFGDQPEVVRLAGLTLVHECGGEAARLPVQGASLRELASHAGADLEAEFSCGADTPPLGDLDAPIELDPSTAEVISAWYDLGWQVMDAFLSELPAGVGDATIQLWPEHFDAGSVVAVPGGDQLNIGFSPGDSFESEPYVYVQPWSEGRPGDADFWNASFGALLAAPAVLGQEDPLRAGVEFLRTGWRHAGGG